MVYFLFVYSHYKITIFAIMNVKSYEIFDSLYTKHNVKVFVKRLDLLKGEISGNKFFKLKYNFSHLIKSKIKNVVTFGGAYSNHLLAVSILCKKYDLNFYGIVRGEENKIINPILEKCLQNKMKIIYVSRKDYKLKNNDDFVSTLLSLKEKYFVIPEGGSNTMAVKGSSEILLDEDIQDYICVSVGTGGTMSGLINSSKPFQKIIGFSSLKGTADLEKNIKSWSKKGNWLLSDNYCFNGFARVNDELLKFIDNFYDKHNIPLDGIYTAKMFFGVKEKIKLGFFPKNSSILLIHSGGLSGNLGLNQRFNLNLKIS